MSKIGRIPIKIDDVQVEVKGQEVHYKGSKASGIYILPNELTATLVDNALKIESQAVGKVSRKHIRNVN